MEAEAKEARGLEEKAAALKPGAFLWVPSGRRRARSSWWSASRSRRPMCSGQAS
jgi:hypothetical protein